MAKSTSTTRYTGKASLAEALVEQYYPCLYRLAASILNDPDEADDAAQETILRALDRWHESPDERAVRGWLVIMAVNHCRDRLRRRKTRQAVLRFLQALHLAGAPKSVEDLAVQNHRHTQLWQAVQALDEKHRLPVLLRFMFSMTAVEIARALQISEGTVYSRLHYAIQKLRERLGEAFDEGGYG